MEQGGQPLLRNTPACAGKTLGPDRVRREAVKHPRLRGEDLFVVRAAVIVPETPPLARGRLSGAPRGTVTFGNTPACAGKTTEQERRRNRQRETPPLARGRLNRWMSGILRRRNTPACAGKTLQNQVQTDLWKKHPRLRGEDPLCSFAASWIAETPPLARGRLKNADSNRGYSGNTPACAGKTFPRKALKYRSRKHPRLRGEDEAGARSPLRVPETPPLARGRRRRARSCRRRRGKHPRLRGEDLSSTSYILLKQETPPLARGRQQHFVQRQASQYKIRCY